MEIKNIRKKIILIIVAFIAILFGLATKSNGLSINSFQTLRNNPNYYCLDVDAHNENKTTTYTYQGTFTITGNTMSNGSTSISHWDNAVIASILSEYRGIVTAESITRNFWIPDYYGFYSFSTTSTLEIRINLVWKRW